jgi:hypothetical protein
MLRPFCRSRVRLCALALLAVYVSTARGADLVGVGCSPRRNFDRVFATANLRSGVSHQTLESAAAEAQLLFVSNEWLVETGNPGIEESINAPAESTWGGIWSEAGELTPIVADAEQGEHHVDDPNEFGFAPQDCAPEVWSWQWLPAGLIYRSYMAGVHEPRMALVAFYESGDRALWDATLGGRVGLWRYGDCDPLFPQGYQLDFYGAAVARLDVENEQDLDATDYVFGFPMTYGVGSWQFKFGYAHISSHLGDELALRDPDTLDERVNYVRDAIVCGVSCYPLPVWRQYAEVGWAFHISGGAQPWEAQFGSELALPGPTGAVGTPFVAVNGRMREEHQFGGDVAVQAGWLRRGVFGQTLRFGAHYYNGKSSQFQFYDNSEEQIGLGLWYDF